MQLLWLAMPGVELSTIESVLWHYIILMYLSSTSHDSEAAMGWAIHCYLWSYARVRLLQHGSKDGHKSNETYSTDDLLKLVAFDR